MLRENLFEKLKCYSDFSSKEKDLILASANYNNARILKEDSVFRKNHSLDDSIQDLSFLECLGAITSKTWAHDICMADQFLKDQKCISLFDRSVILNNWLASNGICPLLRFAFSKWYEIDFPEDVEDLAELSLVYLYKIIPHVFSNLSKNEEFIAEGAYGRVFIGEDKDKVIKYPYNFAAKNFMLDMESNVYKKSIGSDLNNYFAKLYKFHDGIMVKEYIEGVSGWYLLEHDKEFRADPYNLKQLEEIYHLINKFYLEYNINIDMHPGNFQWSYKDNKWFIVDYGAMPKIGSEYFPRDCFHKYFKKIWLDLHSLMKDIPIRSVDLLFYK